MFKIDGNTLLPVFGAAFILAWGMGVFWNWRSWYWRSPRAIYGYLPIGLLFILAAFEEQILTLAGINMWVLRGAYFLLIAAAVWWTVRPPAVIKPWWAKELDARPKKTYSALRAATRQDKHWADHFKDRDTLLAWVKAVEKSSKKAKK
jgi:hypothetical protein